MNDRTHIHLADSPERFVINERTSFTITSPSNETIATLDVVPRHGVLWLTNLWVHHDHRRKHLATALLNAAINQFDDRSLYLNVWAYTNEPMRDEQLTTFYAGFGFEATEVPGTMARLARIKSPTSVSPLKGGTLKASPFQAIVGDDGPELFQFPNGTVVRSKT